MALDDKKMFGNLAADERIADEIRLRLRDGLLFCAAAFDAARKLGVAPSEIGQTADILGIHLSVCQIGLFGFPGHAKGWSAAGVAMQPVAEGFEAALEASRDAKGVLSCAAIWKAADRFGVSRMQAGFVADRLGISIRHCQLGAF